MMNGVPATSPRSSAERPIAAVTGSSSGIGRGIALALAGAGTAVVCGDLQPQPRDSAHDAQPEAATDALIRQRGGEAVFAYVDVSEPDEMEAFVSTATTRYGRLDVMVNNAGIWVGPRTIVEETEEEFDRTMAVNCKGVWLGCKCAISHMLTQSTGGAIVNIASIAGVVALEAEPSYCASKGAVVALTRQLALDFAPKKIRVNAICPGFVASALSAPALGNSPQHNLTPWPRLGRSEDVARAAVFLALDSEWITGACIAVDGGYTAR
jgi:NAD(P)-dependent dehydrogenase (short-subunit alcohol dehydrogenase family)